MDRFDPDIPETLILPGWGVPRELYWNSLERSSFESPEVFDYGFFCDEESPMNMPVFENEIPSVIVGHSMGALLAVKLALQNIEQVSKLILVNPFPKFVRSADFPCGWDPAAVKSMRENLRSRPGSVIRSFLRSCAMPEKYPDPFPETFNIQALDEGLALIGESDIREELQLLNDIPVFILDGDADRIVNREMSDRLARLCPSSVRHTFAGMGHLMTAEHPLECAEKLREMIAL